MGSMMTSHEKTQRTQKQKRIVIGPEQCQFQSKDLAALEELAEKVVIWNTSAAKP